MTETETLLITEKYNGPRIDLLIYVEKDGKVEKRHRAIITKVPPHPCHLTMTAGESFTAKQLADIAAKMYEVDLSTVMRQTPTPAPKRKRSPGNAVRSGNGKLLQKNGKILIKVNELKVGDKITDQGSLDNRWKQIQMYVVSSHKRKKSGGGVVKIVRANSSTSSFVYTRREGEETIEVERIL